MEKIGNLAWFASRMNAYVGEKLEAIVVSDEVEKYGESVARAIHDKLDPSYQCIERGLLEVFSRSGGDTASEYRVVYQRGKTKMTLMIQEAWFCSDISTSDSIMMRVPEWMLQ
jgi:hypothetical protein